jgi:hypothetical protein
MLFAIGGRWIVRAASKTPEAPTLNFYRNFAFEIGAVPPANFVSLRDKMVAQKASTMFSSDSPHFSDHFHLLLSTVVMYN